MNMAKCQMHQMNLVLTVCPSLSIVSMECLTTLARKVSSDCNVSLLDTGNSETRNCNAVDLFSDDDNSEKNKSCCKKKKNAVNRTQTF